MWPRVWQVACSVDHVASAGDWFEHRAGTTSVIIVRGGDGMLRAFQNVCRHRGNLLCEGAGEGLTQLQCPFHHWTWDLEGHLREVPSRKTFGTLRNDDFPLVPVHVDSWGPLVFVNLDPGDTVEPLADYLEGVPADTAWARLDEFRCQVTARIPEQYGTRSQADDRTPPRIAGSEFARAQAPVPAIGGIGRVYVVPNISITGELDFFKIPDSIDERYQAHYWDFDLYGTVNFNDYVGAQIGYRSLDLGYVFEDDHGDFKAKGIYFGGVVRY